METDSVIKDEYLSEKADISTHLLRGEWSEGHEKAVALLQKDPENIELIILAVSASGYGGFC